VPLRLHPKQLQARLYRVNRLFALTALAAGLASAQAPKIGEINFYGLRKVSAEKLLSTLGIHTGDPLPPSKGDLEERLGEAPGVVDARIEAVCCQGPGAALFIGIEERGSPHFNTRGEPAGSAVLPDDVLDAYRSFQSATARGQTVEARRLEESFTAFATDQLELLRDVLRNSSEAEHRAAAAAIAAYVPKKGDIVGDLQYALQDPDETVRANAARALKEIAIQERKGLAPDVKIAPVWLVEMLNSLALGDRLQAMGALVVLTDQPNDAALSLLRERALPALADMARWKTLEYALPAFILLGRAAGVPETDLHNQWEKGDREAVIRKALGK
jgi:HEAT repeats